MSDFLGREGLPQGGPWPRATAQVFLRTGPWPKSLERTEGEVGPGSRGQGLWVRTRCSSRLPAWAAVSFVRPCTHFYPIARMLSFPAEVIASSALYWFTRPKRKKTKILQARQGRTSRFAPRAPVVGRELQASIHRAPAYQGQASQDVGCLPVGGSKSWVPGRSVPAEQRAGSYSQACWGQKNVGGTQTAPSAPLNQLPHPWESGENGELCPFPTSPGYITVSLLKMLIMLFGSRRKPVSGYILLGGWGWGQGRRWGLWGLV